VSAPEPRRTWPTPRAHGALVTAVAAWALGSVWLFRAVEWGYGFRPDVTYDVVRYHGWSDTIAHGSFPVGDQTWQYPPGAGVVMLLPRLLMSQVGYRVAFELEMVLADAAVMLVLVLAARRSGAVAGVWVWALAGPLLGPFLLHRFDLVPTALAVAGLAAARRRPAVAGVLLAAGGLVKVWPAALALAAAGTVRRLLSVAAGAITLAVAAVVALLGTGTLGSSLDFLHQQRARGLEIEAVAATPWEVWHALSHGRSAPPVLQYGAFQVSAPGVGAAVTACTVASVLVAVAVVVTGLRHRPPDGSDAAALALAVVLCLMVVSRVLSAQYLIWPSGLCALALVQPAERRDRRRLLAVALLLLTAAGLTQLLYPLHFGGLLAGAAGATSLLVARNLLLVAATVLAVAHVARRRHGRGPMRAVDRGELVASA